MLQLDAHSSALRAVRAFATSLNVDLVAEGVETSAHLDTVRALRFHRATVPPVSRRP